MMAGYGPRPKYPSVRSRGAAKGTTLPPRRWIRVLPQPRWRMLNWRSASAARIPTKTDLPRGEDPFLREVRLPDVVVLSILEGVLVG